MEHVSYLPFFFRHNCNKSLRKNIFLVSLHLCKSPLDCAHPQLPSSPSPITCAVDGFQHFRLGNSQSPNKFTGKPKIVSHPTSSQERLKLKSTFTFTLCIIYLSTRSMEHPDIYPDSKKHPYKVIYKLSIETCHQ